MITPETLTIFGSDPEGFFKINGQVVGSEKILPKENRTTVAGAIVKDGVQFELNPYAHYNGYQYLVRNINALIREASAIAKKSGAVVSLDGVVEVSREELDSLSPKSRILGCQPSKNIYGPRPITVDVETYRKRSGGGHIHMGLHASCLGEAKRVIALCDIFVGNTCVLLDRDPNAAERRENYGRAGEYRRPRYGAEYRTLSNFWLRSPVLANFVFGLANISTSILFNTIYGKNRALWNELVDAVDLQKVERAINTNDFELAKSNLKGLADYMKTHLTNGFVLNAKNLEQFLAFADKVNEKGGLEYYFQNNDVDSAWGTTYVPTFDTFMAANV